MIPFKNEGIWSNPAMLIKSGSNMYGCATPTSDIDLRGVVVEPIEYLLGRKKFEQYEDKESDTVIWGISKFFDLLERGSPNTVEILFAPESCQMIMQHAGFLLVENRHLFVSKNLTDAIRGFASSEWLKAQLMTKNKETGEVYHCPSVVGAKRKESHATFGYSVKNAYHSIRLLEEGIEILKSGTITFPRPNADVLLSIRNGELSFEQLSAIREQRAVEFAEAEKTSSISDKVDKESIDDLFFTIITDRVNDFSMRKTYLRCRL